MKEVEALKKWIISCVYILALAVTAVNMFFSVRESVKFSMDDLPTGQKIHCASSPDGKYQLEIYRVDNILGTAVRAQIQGRNGTRNIYWQTGIEDVDYEWTNRDTVTINDTGINAALGSYDCRRGYSIFSEGSLEGIDIENAGRNSRTRYE